MEPKRVAVVGGGVCGRAVASILRQSQKCQVDVFDKGRGGTGRVATRRSQNGSSFDTGAQYFTIRHPKEHSWLKKAVAEEKVAEWNFRLGATDGTGFKLLDRKNDGLQRFVAIPGMSKLGHSIDPEGKEHILYGHRVERVFKDADKDDKFFVKLDGEGNHERKLYGPYDAAVITAPPEQAAAILGFGEEFALGKFLSSRNHMDDVHPCQVLLAEFPKGAISSPVDALFINGGWLGTGGWIARNSSKPGRTNKETEVETFVIQAGPEKSLELLEAEQNDELRDLFLDAFFKAFGIETSVKPTSFDHKRWRYARTAADISPQEENPHVLNGGGFLVDKSCPDLLFSSANCCGDGKIENCLLGGYSAARYLLNGKL